MGKPLAGLIQKLGALLKRGYLACGPNHALRLKRISTAGVCLMACYLAFILPLVSWYTVPRQVQKKDADFMLPPRKDAPQAIQEFWEASQEEQTQRRLQEELACDCASPVPQRSECGCPAPP
jgi:hypothetical protein